MRCLGMVTDTKSHVMTDADVLDFSDSPAWMQSAPRHIHITARRRSLYRQFGKRALDLAIAIPLLFAFSPVILVASLLVLATSGWPVFYKARRIGKDGREFSMWKIRSMSCNADKVLQTWRESDAEFAGEFASAFKVKNDPR